MSTLKTVVLIGRALRYSFLWQGGAPGGRGGMLIAFIFAAGINFRQLLVQR